jgi:hypothetical protein
MKLFKNSKLLEESPSDIDALGYENEITHVKMRIDRLINKKKHSIIAYLGPFGVGKSTVLREVQKQTVDYKWITFEMWRYSNRNELWDAFVIRLVSELTAGKDESDIADEVEGISLKRHEWIFALIWIACIWLGLTVLSSIVWWSFKDAPGIGGQFWEAYFKYAAPTILPVLILVGLGKFLQLNFITNKRPLRRVFELESILFNKVKKMKKPLVVVVEDVDRSSEDGAIFLETLNHFLRSLKSNATPFIVIAPQSAQAFNKFDNHSYKGLETALKIYDEKIYFNSLVSDESLVKFYSDLGVDPVWKDRLTQATQAIISAHRKFITIRLLKHALREVVQFSEMNPDINPVIALTIILSRYVEVTDGVNNLQPALRTLDSHQEFGSGGARAFFIAIALGMGKYEQANQAQMFVLNFSSNGEPTSDLITHPNASKQFTINIAGIYGFLVI